MLSRTEIIDLLNNKLPLSKDEYRIDFKAALVLLNIYRECNDIDITVSDDAAKKLCELYPNEDVVSKVYGMVVKWISISNDIECYTSPDKDAVEKSFMHDGFKLVYLNNMLEMYKKLNRPKDQDTIEVLSRFLYGGYVIK